MCNDSQTSSPEPVDRVELLRDERNWHIDILLRTNAHFAFGAAALLAAGCLGASEIRGLARDIDSEWAIAAIVLIAIAAVFVSIALTMHWCFRVRRAKRSAEAISRLLAGDTAQVLDRNSWSYILQPSPTHPLFGWLLGFGATFLLAGILAFVYAIALTPAITPQQ